MNTRSLGLGALGFFLFLLQVAIAAAGESPVADAVMNRDVTELRELIAKNADVKVARTDGSTALHWAIHWEDADAVDLLLKAGADPQAKTRLGMTPLFMAAEI